LDELSTWQPKSYVEHFTDSSFTEKDLAIDAYAVAPEMYRVPFDATVDSANRCIATAIDALATLSEQGRSEEFRIVASEVSEMLGGLVDKASSIINGKMDRMEQAEIDQIMGD
ncbi:MAG: hypothetical protein AAF942_12165, partial [Pseudomonadota bacterium]